jgi:hypothetical protein
VITFKLLQTVFWEHKLLTYKDHNFFDYITEFEIVDVFVYLYITIEVFLMQVNVQSNHKIFANNSIISIYFFNSFCFFIFYF